MNIISRFRKWREERTLQKALAKCRRAARDGYLIASKNLDGIKSAIDGVSADLKQNLSSLNHRQVNTSDVNVQLQKQRQQVVSELYQLPEKSRASLKEKHTQLDKFSIALFGRTMTGKSTLMEILTNGDGSTIGKGGQRTTRDVRSYDWKGLEVTDVPGIAAFEGKEDEEKAFEAASQSDLVLFLITDDAPQDEEAKCLARVRALGKPVLGILNVKEALNNADDIPLLKRKFVRKRLDAIVKQFHEFADKYSPGTRIKFFYTHLRSRFLSQQSEDDQEKAELERASRFNRVEEQIISEVIGRGRFLRWKSFIDIAVAPIIEFSDKLLDFSAQNSSSGRVLVDKRRQVELWSDGFSKSGKESIDIFIAKEMNALLAEIPAFAEDNYDRSDAGNRWERLVTRQDLNRKAQKLAEQIGNECRDELSEIARQLETELNFVGRFLGDRRISMDSIFDSRRAWNWGTKLLSGGLGLTALIFASGPFGWAAAVVGVIGWLFSWLFEDREAKARKQRTDLENKLKSDVNKIRRNLQKQLGDWFHQDLLKKQVSVLLYEFSAITSKVFKLADSQRNLAWELNKHQKRLHRILIDKALGQLGHKDCGNLVLDIARVPGLAIMLLIEPKTKFPEDVRRDLEKLLGEKVWFVINTQRKVSILAQAIGRGCDPSKVSIESKIQVAHVSVDDLNAVGISRIRLAQQLTELHVMKSKGRI